MTPEASLKTLLGAMQPVLNPGTYAFVSLSGGERLDPADIIASIREAEGLSVIVTETVARQAGLAPAYLCAWITLSVDSDLAAVGLTAAFAACLAAVGISCNVVAGTCHDHLFVPVHQARAALQALQALQQTHARTSVAT
jgi:uncharacterized protein